MVMAMSTAEALQRIQTFMYSLLGSLCFFMALFSLLIQQSSPKRKIAIFFIEFVGFIMLISDLLTEIYKGDLSTFGCRTVRVCNFLVYLCIYLELYGLNFYFRTFIERKDGSIPRRLKVSGILSFVGIIPLIISQFNGMFYYFDDAGIYQRGPLFALSYVIPFIVYLSMVSVIVSYRKIFSKAIFALLMFFAMIPIAAAVVQGIWSGGLALFDMSIGFAAVAMFFFSLIDQLFYLKEVASKEKMTGLPNAYGFMSEVGKRIGMRTIANYNAFYFDIVRMGLLNRKYGSQTGDNIIVMYANVIKSRMADDEVLGRLGGNYFVALIRKENTEAFLKLLSGIHLKIDTPMGEEDIKISAVAGVYDIEKKPMGMLNPQLILSNVSMAVNVAKNMIKKPYVFLTPDLLDKLNEQRQIQELIPKCMKLREFVPYYQPKVNTETNKLSGAEALVRWIHEGEIVPPYKFIPMMEQNESICKFDFYMLDYVCGDIREWLDKGYEPPVISINFSRKNLGNPNLASDIYNTVKKHNIPFNLVQIEVTETVDEYPLAQLKSVVEQIQSYGMTAAIDDFGTGSSSIKIMKDVPFNVLKIDKSFIDSTTEKDRKILGYIIAMARSINAGVITEGVEREDQIKILEELGCREIQGYYFDKPLSKEQFEERLKNPEYGQR